MNLIITETTKSDFADIYTIHANAFGNEKEAILTEALLQDTSASPLLSLMASVDNNPVGHILFTSAKIDTHACKVMLLAPLAVMPEAQNSGIGGELITTGLRILADRGVDMVFVLGHPTYYPKYGFIPAGPHGLKAPYPIPEEYSDAWMVQTLHEYQLGEDRGTVIVADKLMQPEHWRE